MHFLPVERSLIWEGSKPNGPEPAGAGGGIAFLAGEGLGDASIFLVPPTGGRGGGGGGGGAPRKMGESDYECHQRLIQEGVCHQRLIQEGGGGRDGYFYEIRNTYTVCWYSICDRA